MKISLKLGCLVLVALLTAPFAPQALAQDVPEKPKVRIAVGGKAALYYLPLTLAERLGYFKDEGLTPEFSDFPGGAKTLQALVGGSADVASGGYEHTINMQALGQNLAAFVLQGRTNGISLGIAKRHMGKYQWFKDLKGMKVGVSAPGSSTNIFLNHLLNSVGLKRDDVSVIGVGTASGAVAAMQSGQLDAISNVDPVMTLLESKGDIVIVAESRSMKGSQAIYGGLMASSCLYAKEEFIKKNPKTVQALTNAMVRALKWLQTATPEQVASTVPPEYLLGDKTLYLAALARMREFYSPDGVIIQTGVMNSYKAQAQDNPTVRRALIMLEQTYDNSFVQRAQQKVR